VRKKNINGLLRPVSIVFFFLENSLLNQPAVSNFPYGHTICLLNKVLLRFLTGRSLMFACGLAREQTLYSDQANIILMSATRTPV